jgi:hypothetical protein
MRPDDLPSFLAPLRAEPRARPTLARTRRRPSARAIPSFDNDDADGFDVLAQEAPDWQTDVLEREELPASAGADAPEADEDGGSAVSRKLLPGVRMIGQQASNWCWSAVTQTVNDFFDGHSLRQDEIATRHLSHTRAVVCQPAGEARTNNSGCTTGGCKGHCNNAHIIRVVLSENGHFDRTIVSNRLPTFREIADEIDGGRPVACRINWTADNSGHFILVAGWTVDAEGKQWVHVYDPKQNEGGEVIAERIMTFVDFSEGYTLMGSRGSINFCYAVK